MAQELWRQLFPASQGDAWQECWHWLYAQNPFWNRPEIYPLVVCRSGDRFIGQLGLIPTRVRLNGKWTEAAWCIDYFLLPDYQRKGIGRQLVDYAIERTPLLMTIGQTEASYTLFVKTGWHDQGRLSWNSTVLRPSHLALKRVGLLTRGEPASKWGGTLRSAGPFGSLKWCVEVVNAWADEPHAFPTQRDSEADGKALVARTAGFMEWRYGRHPRLRYASLKIVSGKTGQLGAYAVVRFGRRGPYQKALLCDLIPGPLAPPALLRRALAALAGFCAQNGAELLDAQMSPALKPAGRLGCMLSKTDPGSRFLYRTTEQRPAIPLSGWQLAPGDCDVDLVDGQSELAG